MPSAIVLTPMWTRQKLTYQMANAKWSAITAWSADVYKTADAATTKTASKLVLRDTSGNFAAGILTLDGVISAVATLPITGDTSITGVLGVSGMITATGGITGNLTGDASLNIKADGTRPLTGNWNAGYEITATRFNGPLTGNVTGNSDTATNATTAANLVSSQNQDIGSYGFRALSFTSDAATGTQPYACTSTTKNTNHNSDLLDGYHAGNSSSQVPVSNGTVCDTLNAHYSNGIEFYQRSSGTISISGSSTAILTTSARTEILVAYYVNNTSSKVSYSITQDGTGVVKVIFAETGGTGCTIYYKIIAINAFH